MKNSSEWENVRVGSVRYLNQIVICIHGEDVHGLVARLYPQQRQLALVLLPVLPHDC